MVIVGGGAPYFLACAQHVLIGVLVLRVTHSTAGMVAYLNEVKPLVAEVIGGGLERPSRMVICDHKAEDVSQIYHFRDALA